MTLSFSPDGDGVRIDYIEPELSSVQKLCEGGACGKGSYHSRRLAAFQEFGGACDLDPGLLRVLDDGVLQGLLGDVELGGRAEVRQSNSRAHAHQYQHAGRKDECARRSQRTRNDHEAPQLVLRSLPRFVNG